MWNFFMMLHNEVYCMKYGTLSYVLRNKCLCHNAFLYSEKEMLISQRRNGGYNIILQLHT
jgi:hypothetical protein